MQAPVKPLSWLRFIDDVEMKWVESRTDLDNFIELANGFHTSIKFTAEISASSNIFLDTTSKIVNGNVEFSLHTKPTDSHLYLMPSSCHPSKEYRKA